MAKRRRFVRCPNCNFEHLVFGIEEIGADLKILVPWSCPICHWEGEVLSDGTLTKKPPE
jgi:hypothetical protein